MKDLTDEEYDRLDEKWTKTTPKVGPNGSGYFSQCKAAADTPACLAYGIFKGIDTYFERDEDDRI